MLWMDFERVGRFMEPWREFERLSRVLSRPAADTVGDFPAVNVWTNGDKALLTSEIPGINPEDLEISVAGKSVTVRGVRKEEELKEGESYHRRERWHGRFSKTLELPFTIETDKVEASVSGGILSVTLPRAEAEKPRKVVIKSE